MRMLLLLLLGGWIAMPAMAQNILLKDGSVITTKGVRRLGDNIMATVQLPATAPGQAPMTGELGYAIVQIERIDFPEPEALVEAAGLVNGGNPEAALLQLKTVLDYYDNFGDLPGSWWAEATVMKEQALIRLGRYDEAESLAGQMARVAADPDSIGAANVYLAAAMARRGDYARAMAIYDAVLKDGTRPQTLAAAAVNKGQIHLSREEWAPALLALLEVPVFYPDQQVLMPDVLLGTAQAYTGLRDFPRAKAALHELSATYSRTPEAAQGQAELQKIAKLEQTVKPLQ